MTSGMIVLALALAAAAGVWGTLLLLWSGPMTAQRRAAVVYTLAVAQPLAILVLSTRTLGIDGAVSSVSHSVSLLGRAMNLAMLGAAATLLIAPGERVGRGGRLVLAGVWAMVLALFVANTVSPASGTIRYEFYFASALTAVVVGVHDRVTLMRWVRRTMRVVVAVSLASAVVAPAWAFIGKGTQGYDRTIFGIPRLTGLSPHPNALSAIAVAALLIEIGLRQGAAWTRVCAGGAAAACIILSQSNTGYIAGASGFLVLMAVRHAGRRRLLVAGAITLFGLYVFVPQAIVPASLSNSGYVNSVSGRTLIWQLSLDAWRQRPITGYGPSIYAPAYQSAHFPDNLQVDNGHDQVVQTLADSGLLGVSGLVLVMGATILCAWRARRVDGGLSLALLAVFSTFGLTETPLRVVGIATVPALATLGAALLGSREADYAAVDDDAEESPAAGRISLPAVPRQLSVG